MLTFNCRSVIVVAFCGFMLPGTDAQIPSAHSQTPIEFVNTLPAKPSDEQLRRLVEVSGDMTVIRTRWLTPGKRLTVSEIAGDKLRSLSNNPMIGVLALEFIEREGISIEQFSSLLNAFRWQTLTDQQSTRLQEAAARNGVVFTRKLLKHLAMSPEKIDEKFDLVISRQLEHESLESIVPACQAILNRSARVLSWNDRLIELCDRPLTGDYSPAPDVVFNYDFRNLILRTLRVNGFPSPDVVDFVETFRPEPGTELYWQHLATSGIVLGDSRRLERLIDSSHGNEFRSVIASVLAEDVSIPTGLKSKVFDAAIVRNDFAGASLGRLYMDQFSPVGLDPESLEALAGVLSRRSLNRFHVWKTQSGMPSP